MITSSDNSDCVERAVHRTEKNCDQIFSTRNYQHILTTRLSTSWCISSDSVHQ